MSKESGIYLIENKVINKNYIGSAVNFDKRFYEHKWALKKNSHCNIHLQRSWNKYGKKSFVFKPYLFCNKKDLIFASDYEYENNNFKIVSKEEGERILEIFNGVDGFKKHSDEIISIIRKERGKISLLEGEFLPKQKNKKNRA